MKRFLCLLGITVLFISCGLSQFENENREDSIPEEITQIEENSTLFEEKSIAETNKDTFVFETNNTAYLTKSGYTIWGITDTNSSETFETIDVSVYKQSGKNDAGYGIVFLNQENNNRSIVVTVMINTKGQYIIGKVINGEFVPISNWKTTAVLYKGFGIINKIKVSYDETNEVFLLYFNESLTAEFKIEEEIQFKNSKSGYVAVISGNEDFPSKSVKVIYTNNK